MKINSINIRIIIVCVCVFAVFVYATLSKEKGGKNANETARSVPEKDMDVKIAMSHGPVKDGLAAFLICEQSQFKLDEPVPLLYGFVYDGPAEYTTIPVLYPAVDSGNISWLSVKGPDGNDVPYMGIYVMFAHPNSRDVLRLGRRCFHGRFTPNIRDKFKLGTPGLYTIKWHWRIRPVDGISSWVGELVSNEIQIEIVK